MKQRIVAIDVLRGFALLGILLMNISSFAMPTIAYFNPTAYGGNDMLNRLVFNVSHINGLRHLFVCANVLPNKYWRIDRIWRNT